MLMPISSRARRAGAARPRPPPPPSPLLDADSDAAQQRRSDLQAAGLLLTEAFVAGTAGGPAAGALGGGEALRRLLFEVFHESISEFRAYCKADVSRGFGATGAGTNKSVRARARVLVGSKGPLSAPRRAWGATHPRPACSGRGLRAQCQR
jgi:hypothetical protein